MRSKSINAVKSAVGLALMSTGLAVSAQASAGENPFLAKDLGSGYQLASKDMEGKCGEATLHGGQRMGRCPGPLNWSSRTLSYSNTKGSAGP